jgi:hypothetical protein
MSQTTELERDDDPPPLPPHGRPPKVQAEPPPRLPCRECQKATLTRTLMLYAGKCYECFEVQCLSTPVGGRDGVQRSTDPKAWAWRLRERELGGERLSAGLAAMWREALAKELRALSVEGSP